jgi:hypothetical protein
VQVGAGGLIGRFTGWLGPKVLLTGLGGPKVHPEAGTTLKVEFPARIFVKANVPFTEYVPALLPVTTTFKAPLCKVSAGRFCTPLPLLSLYIFIVAV